MCRQVGLQHIEDARRLCWQLAGCYAKQQGFPAAQLSASRVMVGTPDVLVRWGHPFFMSFVLLVMGGTVAAQGWQIRTSTDGAAVSKARDQHPKLAVAMGVFFAIGAFGGMGSVIAQGQPLLARLWRIPQSPRLTVFRLQTAAHYACVFTSNTVRICMLGLEFRLHTACSYVVQRLAAGRKPL